MPSNPADAERAARLISDVKKMKKRLRKKKHLGEFAEWGRQIVIKRNRENQFDEFLDAFIEEAIEATGCYCGGGGKEDNLDVIVELGRYASNPEAKMAKITAWLDARPDVHDYKIGDLFDIWHDDYDDIEEKIERDA
ncbi:MAG: 50S ribosome-binding protein YggL [Thermodesulfobacteriota bacterium]|nr:50S ribosome-binding protein YggL [Thermodesulfobacteriota bacterium]